MFKRHYLVRSTLTVAMLSAAVFTPSAHAGLLGGGGNAGLGGGLSGGFSSARGLDAGGSGSGQISRSGAPLPRPASAVNKATDAGQKTDAAARQSAADASAAGAKAGQAAAAAPSKAPRPTGTASVEGSGSARASRGDGAVGADASAEGAVSQ